MNEEKEGRKNESGRMMEGKEKESRMEKKIGGWGK